METTPTIKEKQLQMQPLEVEPQSKLVEEEVKSIELEVGVEPHVVVQNKSTEVVFKKLETHGVV